MLIWCIKILGAALSGECEQRFVLWKSGYLLKKWSTRTKWIWFEAFAAQSYLEMVSSMTPHFTKILGVVSPLQCVLLLTAEHRTLITSWCLCVFLQRGHGTGSCGPWTPVSTTWRSLTQSCPMTPSTSARPRRRRCAPGGPSSMCSVSPTCFIQHL